MVLPACRRRGYFCAYFYSERLIVAVVHRWLLCRAFGNSKTYGAVAGTKILWRLFAWRLPLVDR